MTDELDRIFNNIDDSLNIQISSPRTPGGNDSPPTSRPATPSPYSPMQEITLEGNVDFQDFLHHLRFFLNGSDIHSLQRRAIPPGEGPSTYTAEHNFPLPAYGGPMRNARLSFQNSDGEFTPWTFFENNRCNFRGFPMFGEYSQNNAVNKGRRPLKMTVSGNRGDRSRPYVNRRIQFTYRRGSFSRLNARMIASGRMSGISAASSSPYAIPRMHYENAFTESDSDDDVHDLHVEQMTRCLEGTNISSKDNLPDEPEAQE